MRISNFFILICTFLSPVLCAQQTSSKTSIVFDFSPFTQSISRQVVDEVGNSPLPFESTNSATYSGEITVLRNFAHWSFGIGVSTNSFRQNFNHTFYLEPDNEISRYQTYIEFKSFGFAPHAVVQWKKQNVSLGLRIGRYTFINQNNCPEDLQIIRYQSGPGNLKIETDLKRRCRSSEDLSFKNLFELEFMTRIHNDFWAGLTVNYRGSIRSFYRTKLFSFSLAHDQDFAPENAEPPLINDISIYEPRFQLGVNLRYELKLKKKTEPLN